MNEFKFRRANLEDIENIIKLEKMAWPDSCNATSEMFESRIRVFPEGNIISLINDEVVGVVSTEIIKYNFDLPRSTWYEITDNGFIRGTHNLEGDAIYGVDLSVLPNIRGRGLGKKLLSEIGRMAIRKNIHYGMLGGRLPEYYKYSHLYTIDEYLDAKNTNGKILDPELRFYVDAGLEIRGTIKDYFRDPQSFNYGVLLVWNNPFYQKNKMLGKFVGNIINRLFKV